MKRKTRRALKKWKRRGLRAMGALPLPLRVAVLGCVALAALALVNWIYQAARKPSELLFPVSGVLFKTPATTWREYGSLFREHATAVMTAEMLAALAQVEGGGNPLARTYWRWKLAWHPFQVYRPASSAVGMYQITDARFLEAKRYCIRNHRVVEQGPWHDLSSCWFNGFYNRLVADHAIEMTSAFLDRSVAGTLARARIAAATLQHKQNLAAVIHLCGASAGEAFARRGFRPSPGQRCGDHLLEGYLAQLDAAKQQFARLAGASGT